MRIETVPRTLLVSNRLPVTIRADRGRFVVGPSSGGLVTGLRGLHQQGDSLWIGWPGDLSRLAPEALASLEPKLAELRFVPVPLSSSEIARYYDGFSNAVLWPLFHYLVDRIPPHGEYWEAYRSVNQKFADATAKLYGPGDLIWIHDYQLMLLPALLRRRLPNAKIGFFLHIPFPAVEVFRTLPWREAVLQGLLGADLVGFHTLAYLRHFAASLTRILGIPVSGDRLRFGARQVSLGVFPMGVDVQHLREIASLPVVLDEVESLRKEARGERIMLGVDRLDYTKGMVRRLLAFERLLERRPEVRGKVRMMQVAVPSRDKIPSYQDYRREVNEHVGRINGAFASLDWVPIRYVYRPFSEPHLVALYLAADVMVVTPLRDGMNLVAKEFVACRADDDGVLVLSEFAGAAPEMSEALVVNPYDVDALSNELYHALKMPEEERRFRMGALRARVAANDVGVWTRSFISALESAETHESATNGASLDSLAAKLRTSPEVLMLLDYDGTLVPFAAAPDLAVPDAQLLELLRSLGSRSGWDVHIVSGRKRDTMERWLGGLPVSLHAEHGYWSRPRPTPDNPSPGWEPARDVDVGWKAGLKDLLERFRATTPGALVEEKTASLAWHYRLVEPDLAGQRTDELRRALEPFLRDAPLELLDGDKVLEVRLQGVTKAVVAQAVHPNAGSSVLAMGDDTTDADMFRALPPGAATVGVGPRATIARYRVDDPEAARRFLVELVQN